MSANRVLGGLPFSGERRGSALKMMSLPDIASAMAAAVSTLVKDGDGRNRKDARFVAASVLSDARDPAEGDDPDPARLRARTGDREGELAADVDGEEEGARNIPRRSATGSSSSPSLLLVDSSDSTRPSGTGRINPSYFPSILSREIGSV